MGVELSFTDRQRRALRYCTYCPRLCRFACPVAHGEARETVTPWGLMRLLNLVDQAMVTPDVAVLETLNHCMSCGRCTSNCLHDNPVAEVLAQGRSELIKFGLQQPERYRPQGAGCDAGVSPAMGSDAPDVPVFLPSCAHRRTDSDIRRLREAVEALSALGLPLRVPAVGADQGCGYHRWELGDQVAAETAWDSFSEPANSAPLTVTDCAPSLSVFGDPAMHLAEWLAAHLNELPNGSVAGPVAIHDSCFVSRRLGLDETVRTIVGHLVAGEILDLFEARDQARCCGSQGYWARVEPEAQARAASTVADDIIDSGARIVVTGSPACRRGLADALEPVGIEVLDLLGLIARCRP
jgi:Fe-S oxidoreductase